MYTILLYIDFVILFFYRIVEITGYRDLHKKLIYIIFEIRGFHCFGNARLWMVMKSFLLSTLYSGFVYEYAVHLNDIYNHFSYINENAIIHYENTFLSDLNHERLSRGFVIFILYIAYSIRWRHHLLYYYIGASIIYVSSWSLLSFQAPRWNKFN